MDFSLFGIVNNLNKLNNNKENYDSNTNNLNNLQIILTLIVIIISIALFIWAIYVLVTFKLPQEILVLCIVLLLLTGPIIPLILAYIFKNKQINYK